MTKVDEHAHVHALDPAALQGLKEALDRSGVVSAVLFGSQADGSAGPLSDVDIGVWTDSELPREARAELRLALADRAARALGTDEVDLVLLNDAPPLLRHRALGGRRLVERDAGARVRLETAALLEYLDTAPLRETLAAGAAVVSPRGRLVDGDRLGARLSRLEAVFASLGRLDDLRAFAAAAQRLADEG